MDKRLEIELHSCVKLLLKNPPEEERAKLYERLFQVFQRLGISV
ncbi:hypothetical protein [Ammoniphilus sp. 3BR4]